MSLVEKLIKDFQTLPEDKKIEVIDFVDFLKNKNQKKIENMMDLIIVENNIKIFAWFPPAYYLMVLITLPIHY